MNKKGFSLIELLGVLCVLGILACIVAVPVTKSIKDANINACKSQFQTVIEAAKQWGNENIYSLPDDINETSTVSILTLKEAGLLENDLKNPIDKSNIDDTIVVNIKKTGKRRWEYSINEDVVNTNCK